MWPCVSEDPARATTSGACRARGSDDNEHETQTPVQELQQLFPHYDSAFLGDIMMQTNGNIEEAVRLLSWPRVIIIIIIIIIIITNSQ